ncbi:SDR family oxidoreductase [Amycolatopsis sp. NBC_01488]|uniref:SDR family oxidoreductase n=1 Tax=Amycolatopsis sp. NBC_01488 TaxID=2903563 RepID=UPI002E2AB98B|nr:SDR family oxidoreductase [Amycolatopsis sp. NBC_01488]
MILVTGATGLTGSAVIRACVAEGLPVRALVRDRAKAAGFPDGVEVVTGDLLAPEPALDGVDRALLISSADRRLVETQQTFIDAAKRAGVGHVVKLSGRGCRSDSGFRFARMHADVERYLAGSGLAWSVLRPSQFMPVYFREVPSIRDGVLSLPMGEAKLAPVDVGDIARVAVALLRGEGEDGGRYELTGPEALTMTEVAARLADAVGRPVRYVDADPAAQRERLLAAGIPAFFADAMDELFAERRAGAEESRVDLGTHEKFGVRPTTFAEFARRNAAVFRGEVPPSHRWASGWQPA